MVAMFGGYEDGFFFFLFCRLGAYFAQRIILTRRNQCPRSLMRGSAVARLLGLWVRIPPGNGRLSVVSVVLLGGGLCDGLIARPEESY